jgi:hypothetical protein
MNSYPSFSPRLRSVFKLVALLGFALSSQVIAYEVTMEKEPWITVGEDGVLVYRADERGNTIPDFSRSGYRGGGVALPLVPVLETLESHGLDDEAGRIQAALDRLGESPADEEGRRGALLLKRGVYRLGQTLRVPGGVVLRGEGSGEDGTLLRTFGRGWGPIIAVGSQDGREADAVAGSSRPILDEYVPWSEKTLTLEFADDLQPGDRVLVIREGTDEWISLLGMDRMEPWEDPSRQVRQWTAEEYTFAVERFVEAVEGNRVRLDAPLMIAIDSTFGGGRLERAESHRPVEAGVEHLRIESEYPKGQETRMRDIPKPSVEFCSVENAWARDVTVRYSDAAFRIRSEGIFVTVADCRHYDPVGPIQGGYRASFTVWGQYVLVINGYARNSRHAFMTGARVRGPSAFVEGVSEQTHSASGPHQRFAIGQLYDVIADDESLIVRDRGNWGSGHGWAGAQQVFWNVTTPLVMSQQAPTTSNYVVGGLIGEIQPGRFPDRTPGSFDRIGQIVEPRSLYRAQLRERLNTDITH